MGCGTINLRANCVQMSRSLLWTVNSVLLGPCIRGGAVHSGPHPPESMISPAHLGRVYVQVPWALRFEESMKVMGFFRESESLLWVSVEPVLRSKSPAEPCPHVPQYTYPMVSVLYPNNIETMAS